MGVESGAGGLRDAAARQALGVGGAVAEQDGAGRDRAGDGSKRQNHLCRDHLRKESATVAQLDAALRELTIGGERLKADACAHRDLRELKLPDSSWSPQVSRTEPTDDVETSFGARRAGEGRTSSRGRWPDRGGLSASST